jgi:AcrR family transcriptional regulator
MVQTAYDRILTEAARLFYEKGYHATSMEDLAAAVGIKKGSLYYYIESKEQLFFEIAEVIPPKFIANVSALLEDTQLTAEQKLRIAITKHLELFETEMGLAWSRIFLLEYRALPGKHQRKLLEQRQHYENVFRKLVADGVERGEFAQVDVAIVTRAILGMCNWAMEWYSTTGKLSGKEIASSFSELILKGLLKSSNPVA